MTVSIYEMFRNYKQKLENSITYISLFFLNITYKCKCICNTCICNTCKKVSWTFLFPVDSTLL